MADNDAYEEEIELSWSNVTSVWWLVTWRTTAGAAVFSLATGMIVRVLGGAVGADREVLRGIGAMLGVIIGLVWGFVVVRMALRKQYKSFRVALVSQRG